MKSWCDAIREHLSAQLGLGTVVGCVQFFTNVAARYGITPEMSYEEAWASIRAKDGETK